jgi:hypothetical protein
MKMMKKLGIAVPAVVFVALLLLSACNSEPAKPAAPAEKPQPKAAELATGRTAFQRTFISARGWARDAQPFRLESQPNPDSKGQDGKSAIWRASFASPAQRGLKPFTWSGTSAPDAPSRGVSPGSEDTYSPNNSSTQVFDMGFLKVDSDKALEVAKKHGGDKVLQKNPDTNVFYVLDWNHQTNELTWHVIFGDNRDDPKLRVAVNASTGEFLRVEK